MIEKRTKTLTIRVCPDLLEQAKEKLNEDFSKRFANAKNKRYVTKETVADIFEQALINFISRD